MPILYDTTCLKGSVLSDQGVSVEEAKVQTVKDARKPENAAEVNPFLGL